MDTHCCWLTQHYGVYFLCTLALGLALHFSGLCGLRWVLVEQESVGIVETTRLIAVKLQL